MLYTLQLYAGSITSSRSSELESASISGKNNPNNINYNNNSKNTTQSPAYRGRCHTMSDISELSANKSVSSLLKVILNNINNIYTYFTKLILI